MSIELSAIVHWVPVPNRTWPRNCCVQVRLPDLDPHLASLKQFALEVGASGSWSSSKKWQYLLLYLLLSFHLNGYCTGDNWIIIQWIWGYTIYFQTIYIYIFFFLPWVSGSCPSVSRNFNSKRFMAGERWMLEATCLSPAFNLVSFKPVSVAPMNVGFDLIYQRPDHPCRNRFQGCFFSWNLGWISTSVREAMQTVSCRLNFPMLPRSQKSAYGNLSIWWLLPLHCGHCWSVDIWHPFSSQIWNHRHHFFCWLKGDSNQVTGFEWLLFRCRKGITSVA